MRIIDKYTNDELEILVQASTSYRDLARKLGYSTSCSGDTIKNLQKWTQNFDCSHFNTKNSNNKLDLKEIFIEKSKVSQKQLRKYYLREEYTEYVCAICKQEPFWQGKPLTLILDHINGINNDDRLENLRWVCPNCNQQLETTGSRNIHRKNKAKKYYCLDCGKEISAHSLRCQQCANKQNIIPEEKMPITRIELKKLIRNTPFTSIGKLYNVSDNAVRKWCIKYNLPSKKKEINKYTDEEWCKL